MSRSVFRKKTPLSPSLPLSPFFFFCQTRLFRDFPLTSGLAVRQRRSGLTDRRAQGVGAGEGGAVVKVQLLGVGPSRLQRSHACTCPGNEGSHVVATSGAVGRAQERVWGWDGGGAPAAWRKTKQARILSLSEYLKVFLFDYLYKQKQ